MGIFSETIVIHHDRNKKWTGNRDNGDLEPHFELANGFHQSKNLLNKSTSFESHTVEKKFSLNSPRSLFNGHVHFKDEFQQPVHKKGYSGDFTTCFVRSEIKWVFLKDVKVINVPCKEIARKKLWIKVCIIKSV